jgi:hypothetical protein
MNTCQGLKPLLTAFLTLSSPQNLSPAGCGLPVLAGSLLGAAAEGFPPDGGGAFSAMELGSRTSPGFLVEFRRILSSAFWICGL